MNTLAPPPCVCLVRAKEYCKRHYKRDISELSPNDRACVAYTLVVKCEVRPANQVAVVLDISYPTLKHDLQWFDLIKNASKPARDMELLYRYILYMGRYTRRPTESYSE